MNQTDLTRKLAKKLHFHKYFAKLIITTICDEITKELKNNKRFYLQDLGAFHPIHRPKRRWRSPKTGKLNIKPAHKDITFTPSKTLLKNIV